MPVSYVFGDNVVVSAEELNEKISLGTIANYEQDLRRDPGATIEFRNGSVAKTCLLYTSSNQPEEIVNSIPDPKDFILKSGRLVALFLQIERHTEIEVNPKPFIISDDYTFTAKYNGLAWLQDGYVQLNTPRLLDEKRLQFHNPGEALDPIKELQVQVEGIDGMHNIATFTVDGTPLRGTHVLRLMPEKGDLKMFEKATLTVYRKSYRQKSANS